MVDVLPLSEICQMALEEISGIAVPTTYIGNSNLTAKTMVRLANRSGRNYALGFRWDALLQDYEFQTADGVSEYDLPDGFHAFSHLTFWSGTNLEVVRGPVGSAMWQALTRGQMVAPGMTKYFRISSQGRKFQINPTPTAVETISYMYYSKFWVDSDDDGVGDAEYFVNDTDVTLIDGNLVCLDLKWRFRKSKGLDWEAEKLEADILRDQLLSSDDGGKPAIDFTPVDYAAYDLEGGNIPETGAGL